MKRKIGRTLLGIMMGVILAVTTTPNVNAEESASLGEEMIDEVVKTLSNDNPVLEVIEDEVQEDVEILDAVGLNCEMIDDVEVDDEDIIYTFNYPDRITDEISVDAIDNDIVLNITEGNIRNELKICDDGSMYLDGVKIQTEDDKMSDEIADHSALIDYEERFRQSSGEVMNWVTTSCPYGKKGDYNYKLGTIKDADVTLTATISNLTFTAFMIIIGIELGINPKLSTCLSEVFNYIRTRNPSTRGLSYKATNYAHKKYHNTYIKPIRKRVYKSNYKWYPEKKYKGKVYSKTYYCMKQIGY